MSNTSRGIALALLVIAHTARAAFTPVYTADVAGGGITNDLEYAQVGNLGANTGTHAVVTPTNEALRFIGRYQNNPSKRLKGLFLTNSLELALSFRLYNTATSETRVAAGWRMKTNVTANTWPLYYVALERCPTNGAMSTIQLVKRWESAAAAQAVYARYDYVPSATINTSVFTWNIRSEIVKTNQFGDTLAISVVVSNNGAPFCTLSYTGAPLERTGSNATPAYPAAGGIGVLAGPLNNNSTFSGMDLLALSVAEDPVHPVAVADFKLGAIGNSFTYYNNTYPYILYDFAAVAGHTMDYTIRALSGRTLKMHCTETNTLQWIADNACDYYAINELSMNTQTTQGIYYAAWRTNEFTTYADMMISTIQTHHAGAPIFLYEPWAPKTNILATSGFNAQPDLTAFFTNFAASRPGVEVLPFGRAMQRVHQQHASPDPAVLSGDASEHPAPAGTYLIAAVAFARLYNESPEGLPYVKDTGASTAITLTNRNYAYFLQRVAWDTYKNPTFASPPRVAVTIPNHVPPNTAITLSAAATDNGTITNYLWAFGDGTTTNGPDLASVSHVFTVVTNGFDVNVAVQDDDGEWERVGRWVIFATNAQIITGFLPTNGSTFATNEAVGLSAQASSGLSVTFSVASGPGALDGSGTNLSFSGTGTVAVVAAQAGDAAWLAATPVTNLYTVAGATGDTTQARFNGWLSDQGLGTEDPRWATGNDHDGDGRTTWEEFIADTNPDASNSVFGIQPSSVLAAGQFRLAIPASTGRYYQLLTFTNLLSAAAISNLGWGMPSMIITNTPGPAEAASWGLHVLLDAP